MPTRTVITNTEDVPIVFSVPASGGGGGGIATAITGVAYGASGVTAATGTLSSATSSNTLAPLAGRDFNIKFGTPGASLGGSTIVLERNLEGTSTWAAVTYIDGTVISWSVGVNTSWTESETGILYRLNCTVYGGTPIAYRLEQ